VSLSVVIAEAAAAAAELMWMIEEMTRGFPGSAKGISDRRSMLFDSVRVLYCTVVPTKE